ncbi:hypothetical protein [Nocardia sp. NPDC049707]|uniref:hypothetical protein n=1 Tax=Nocardia sp. NPDC049707 TaxID=3154735 RepID=UPI0034487F19
MPINPLPPPSWPNHMPIGFREETILARDLPNVAPRARLKRPEGMHGPVPEEEATLLLDAYQNESGAWVAVIDEKGTRTEIEYRPEDQLQIGYVLYEEG